MYKDVFSYLAKEKLKAFLVYELAPDVIAVQHTFLEGDGFVLFTSEWIVGAEEVQGYNNLWILHDTVFIRPCSDDHENWIQSAKLMIEDEIDWYETPVEVQIPYMLVA